MVLPLYNFFWSVLSSFSLPLSSNPLRSRSSAVHLSTSTDASSNSLFGAGEETFTVDDIEIHQLEDEESQEIQPSFGPTVG